MKKSFLLITALSFLLPLNAEITRQKIKKMDIPVQYDAQKYNSVKEISYKQMLKDLDEFCYIVETCYAGYDDAVKNGLDVAAAKKAVIKSYKKGQPVDVEYLVQRIYEQFSPYIKDYHGYIGKNSGYRFITPTLTYFSNTYVKKENEKLYVVQSDDESLQPGDEITCDSNLLFNYPAKGENVYRLGCLSEENPESISVQKAGDSIMLPLKVVNTVDNGFEYYTKENDKAIYIRYSQCYFNNDSEYEALLAFSDAAKLCRNKEAVILDIRGNPGGDDTYSKNFFNDLCFYNKDYVSELNDSYDSNEIPMPNTVFSYMSIKGFVNSLHQFANMEDEGWKEFERVFLEMEKEQEKKPQKIIAKTPDPKINTHTPFFNGKVIVITDNGVCSSGESIIEQAYKNFSNTTQFYQIGTNTAGCGAYGNICYYYLSNSGITVRFGITDFTATQKLIPSFHGEGKGYIPDYWCTKEDIADTVFYITKDEEIKNFVKAIFN